MPEKEVAAANGEQDKGRIHQNLDLCEGPVRNLADDYRDTLARHGHRTAPDLEGDPDTHDRTARQLGQQLRRQGCTFQSGSQSHIKVDQPAEDKADDQLEKLHGIELSPQNEYLAKHQQTVHRDRISADRPLRNMADRPGQREHERQGGDHAASQRGADTQDDPQGHQIK